MKTKWISVLLSAAVMFGLHMGTAQMAKYEEHTPLLTYDFEAGTTTGWTSHSGTWSVVSDSRNNENLKALKHTVSNVTGRMVYDTSSYGNATVKMRINRSSANPSGHAGIIGRFTDANNHYFLRYNGGTSSLEILKRVSGTVTTLASSTSFTLTDDEYHSYRFDMNGSTLTGYVDGVQRVSTTDTSFSSGKIGVYSNFQIASFDDVKVFTYGDNDLPVPLGVYNLKHAGNPTDPDQLPDTAAMAKDYVDGASVRTYWEFIETSDNTYDWSYFDDSIARAKAEGKKAALRIMNGSGTPAWVYTAGAASYSTVQNGSTISVPVPWDTVFQQKYKEVIKAFGQRYNNHPDVAYIAMSMPGGNWAELFHPSELTALSGYTDSLWYDSHFDLIDAYEEAFPDTPITLALTGHGTFTKIKAMAEELTDYLNDTLGQNSPRIYVQSNGWAGNGIMGSSSTFNQKQYIPFWEKGIAVGAQQIAADKWKSSGDTRMGDQYQANMILLQLDGNFAEVYEDDVLSNATAVPKLEQLHDLLALRAYVSPVDAADAYGDGRLVLDLTGTVKYTTDGTDPKSSGTAVTYNADGTGTSFTGTKYVRFAVYDASSTLISEGGYPFFGGTSTRAGNIITHTGASKLKYTTGTTGYPFESGTVVTGSTLDISALATGTVVRVTPVVIDEFGAEVALKDFKQFVK